MRARAWRLPILARATGFLLFFSLTSPTPQGGNGNADNVNGYLTASGERFVYDKEELGGAGNGLATFVDSIPCCAERCYTTVLERSFPGYNLYPSEDKLYGCNRAGESLSWRWSLAPGSYRATFLFQEDKWQEFPKQNNGREFYVYLQRQLVDRVNIFGELGMRRTPLDLSYCFEVGADGAFDLDMVNIIYGASPSAMVVESVAAGSCRETIHKRVFDVWYTPTPPWVYAINTASGGHLSKSGVSFSPDFGFWLPGGRRNIDGLWEPGWSGQIGWARCGMAITCNTSTFDAGAGCNCGKASGCVFRVPAALTLLLLQMDTSTRDGFVQMHKREATVGNPLVYTLPLNSTGLHWVFFTTFSHDFPNDFYRVCAESGEGSNHELCANVDPGLLARTVVGTAGDPLADFATAVGLLVNVRGPNLDLSFTVLQAVNPARTTLTTSTSSGGAAVVSSIMVQPAAGLTAAPPAVPLESATAGVPMPLAQLTRTTSAACVPSVCAVGMCGSWSNGCGGTLTCGGCPVGQRCSNDGPWNFFGQGRCESDCKPRACAVGECGHGIDDGCNRCVRCVRLFFVFLTIPPVPCTATSAPDSATAALSFAFAIAASLP